MTMRRARKTTTGFLREFQEFALKGNVVDLAIAVIIGGAFGKIVTSFVQDIIMPLVNPLIPGGNWREAQIGAGIKIGAFMGAVVDFVIIALILFVAVRSLQQLRRQEAPLETPPTDPAAETQSRLVDVLERIEQKL